MAREKYIQRNSHGGWMISNSKDGRSLRNVPTQKEAIALVGTYKGVEKVFIKRLSGWTESTGWDKDILNITKSKTTLKQEHDKHAKESIKSSSSSKSKKSVTKNSSMKVYRTEKPIPVRIIEASPTVIPTPFKLLKSKNTEFAPSRKVVMSKDFDEETPIQTVTSKANQNNKTKKEEIEPVKKVLIAPVGEVQKENELVIQPKADPIISKVEDNDKKMYENFGTITTSKPKEENKEESKKDILLNNTTEEESRGLEEKIHVKEIKKEENKYEKYEQPIVSKPLQKPEYAKTKVKKEEVKKETNNNSKTVEMIVPKEPKVKKGLPSWAGLILAILLVLVVGGAIFLIGNYAL